ncbi:MAG: DUF1513 domain-containing protein [Pseudomonadota bacterium]
MGTRRNFLRDAALGLGIVACGGAWAQRADTVTYVGVETSARGVSILRFFDESGGTLGRTPLDFRAHGMAEHGNRLIAFPRRPGDRFAVMDKTSLEILGVEVAPAERHFYGHGAFSRDGKHLIVPENAMTTLQGALAVYETAPQIRRLATVALPGAGPHEIIRAHDRDLFYIALGGLETHPAYGRDPLNLGDFRSQILTFDLTSGDVLQMGLWPGSEGVSLRHLAAAADGRLYVGGQIPGDGTGAVMWHIKDGQAAQIDGEARLGGYVSSVAADGNKARFTSKVTGAVLTLQDGSIIDAASLEGASAVAMHGGRTVTAGFQLLKLDDAAATVTDGHEFDNHGILF